MTETVPKRDRRARLWNTWAFLAVGSADCTDLMETDCRDVLPLLQLLLDGELAEPEASETTAHLRSCAFCSLYLDQTRVLRSLVRQVHREDCQAPQRLRQKLEDSLLSARQQTPTPLPLRRFRARRSPPVAYFRPAATFAVAMLVGALAVGVMAGGVKDPEPPSNVGESALASAKHGSSIRTTAASIRPGTSAEVAPLRANQRTARRLKRRLLRIDRIHVLDGPALLYTFSNDGRIHRIVQSADRTVELGPSPNMGAWVSPVPSFVDETNAWSPPTGPVTVAAFTAAAF